MKNIPINITILCLTLITVVDLWSGNHGTISICLWIMYGIYKIMENE